MISSDLHAVGFDFPTWEDLMQASLDKEDRGAQDVGGWEFISPYTDPSGARLQRYYRNGEWSTSTSFLAQHSRWTAGIGMINERVALVDLATPDDETLTRLTVEMDDPFLYPELDSQGEGPMLGLDDVSVTALAVGVNVFPDVESWRGNESWTPSTADSPDGPVSMFGEPGYLVCPWVFEYFGGGDAAEIAPYSQLVVEVEAVEIRTNVLSGAQFYVARGSIFPGMPPLEVCLPLDVGTVQVGSVIDGAAMMVGTSGVWDR
ncbi:hypothetical protein [Corynebacterium nasicanis]|uniref:Uncharacterized protein n=1 Tax=Corynebacterium nasicanis TaxID=1448267 RepID=A0ABW1QEF7_9CORY